MAKYRNTSALIFAGLVWVTLLILWLAHGQDANVNLKDLGEVIRGGP